MRDHARRIAHANDADLSWPLDKIVPGLLHVQEVFWYGGDKAAPVSLLVYLLDLPWKRTYWKEMARHRNHQNAAFEARKRHGTLTSRSGRRESQSPRRARWHRTMRVSSLTSSVRSPSPGTWPEVICTGLDGRLSLIAAQHEDGFPEFSGNRSAHLVAFATRYGPVLADPFVQSLPDHPIHLQPAEPRP